MDISTTKAAPQRPAQPKWAKSLRSFKRGSWGRGTTQILNSVIPYALLWATTAAIIKSGLPNWLTLATILPAALFLVRIFIVFHDCVHGSFYPSRRGNRTVGLLTGILTFTPFERWRRLHLKHHATNGQLDHRGKGDIWTMTTDEYATSTWSTRLGYRLFRFPPITFLLGPVLMQLIYNRFAPRGTTRAERLSVVATNLSVLLVAAVLSLVIGLRTYLLVQIPILWIANIIGVWLFYVQHQFDPGYWARDHEWNQFEASLYGSSYYKLPRLLNWLTGSIGIHHLHHLFPVIPSYNLVPALRATPEIQLPNAMTIRASLKTIRMSLWHESDGRFVSFREAGQMMKA